MKIKEKILKNTFCPTIPWGLVNPFFINRKLLAETIESEAQHLHGKILDYGCGSKPYKSLFRFYDYIGIDIENAGHPHTNEDIDLFFDGKTIPFEDGTFDSCFSSEVLEHVFDIDKSLAEIKRVLRPNGKILITTPFVWDEHEAPHDFCRYSSFGLKEIIERNGFRVIKQKKNGCFSELIIQLLLIHLNRKLVSNRLFKYPFLLIICPVLNLLSVMISSINDDRGDKTIYLGQTLVAEKIS